jgi:N,N'-diacetyllegionaminate synthase
MSKFKVNNRSIGPLNEPYIIAEIAQAHDGSLGLAHTYIEAVASAGASAVKFQTHFAAEESTKDEQWRVKFSYQDASRYEYWQRMEFTEEQWAGLKEHADRVGIDFISTPFSLKAVKLLDKLNVPLWKIGSGEINNLPLLKEVAQTGRPVVISSGMSPMSEVDAAVSLLREYETPFSVLQCTTSYPCPANKIGLNNIQKFSTRYDCPVGLSDHSGRPFAGLAAVTLGASIIEVHVVFDKKMFGPDASSSLNFDELKLLVEGSRDIFEMHQNPVDKDMIANKEMISLRELFNKSIVLSNELQSGSVLTLGDLSFKKPGIGITPEQVDNVVGKVLKQTLPRDHFLSFDDLEEGV